MFLTNISERTRVSFVIYEYSWCFVRFVISRGVGEQWFTVICYLNVGFAFHWWNLFQTKNHVILEAEQLFSEDDDDGDDDENEVDFPSDVDDDDLDSSSGSEEIPEASGQVQQLTIQEEGGEELESEQEQEPDRIKIHE